jgi:tetratricopeptide (TPR) repeat protein
MENPVMKKHMHAIGIIVMMLSPAVTANAYHGGGHGGGGGFHGGGGGGGGFRGGGYGGGGFRAGGYGGGGFGGYRGGYSAPAFNRTPSFSMPHTMTQMPRTNMNEANRFNSAGNVNRANSFNNVNRANSFNNVNRATSINNVNRVGSVNNVNRVNSFNNVNRMGAGWHNPYMGYHQGWVHGYWNGHYPGGFGWRPYGYGGYGYGGFGGLGYGLGGFGLGLGLGWGLSSWMYGPMLNNWGYSNYYNPYYGGYGVGSGGVVQQPIVYDYAQPIDPQAAVPEETVTTQAMSTFDSARESFKAADYAKALELVNVAIKSAPNDAALHEFRALCLFALKQYDDSASALYAVLSAGPGWDWTTLISLYGDPETYTQQLRALEAYCSQNQNSASAHFVLAYHYLTEEHPEAAVRQLKAVTSLQPKDTLSAQLITQLEQSQKPAAATDLAQAPGTLNPAPGTPAATTAPAGKAGKLEGTWSAQPTTDTKITVVFQNDTRFSWTVVRQGKEQKFEGKLSFENGILTLVQDQNNNTMVGNVAWQDESHFNFKVMGGPPADPGLSFAKTS